MFNFQSLIGSEFYFVCEPEVNNDCHYRTSQAWCGVPLSSDESHLVLVKITQALKWSYLSLHPGYQNTKSETHQVESRQVAELFVCDVGYKCGSEAHNGNQV